MDFEKFLHAKFAPRTRAVAVPELADFFGEDVPEWTVRNLSAIEFGRAMEESTDSYKERIQAMADALAGDGDKAEPLRKLLGISREDVPADISRRISELTIASVSPELGEDRRDIAVQLAENYPNVFFRVTNAVRELTDQGAELGK